MLACGRDPSRSERDRNDYKGIEERVSRCLAFGQFAEPVPDDAQRVSQMGLMGSAAGLQILSDGPAVRAGRGRPSAGSQEDRWLDRYLRCVNFIDLVVSPPQKRDGELWRQRRLTLRACGLLRAVAASAEVLKDLTELELDERHGVIVGDLSAALGDLPRRHSQQLVEFLLASRVAIDQVDGAWSGFGGDTYAFAATSSDAPATADEWTFVWGSVTAAAVRAHRASLISDGDLERLVSAGDANRIRKVISESQDLEKRHKLFGLWALSHLDPHTLPAHGRRSLPMSLVLDDGDRAWIAEQTLSVVNELLAREVALIDSWTPYTTYLGERPSPEGRLGTADAEQKQPDRQDFRNDVMVVPVVPILLGMLTEYQPKHLCRKEVQRLIAVSMDPELRRDLGRAKPYQLGIHDGMVNLSYWQETYSQLERASSDMAERRAMRGGRMARITSIEYGKWAAVFTIVLIAGLAYAINTSNNVLVGVLFGVLASVLAALISPPLVSWMWDDR